MRIASGATVHRGADCGPEFASTQCAEAAGQIRQELTLKVIGLKRRFDVRCTTMRRTWLIERGHRRERDQSEKHRGNAYRRPALAELAGA
jgi:hypothetical protein